MQLSHHEYEFKRVPLQLLVYYAVCENIPSYRSYQE